MCRCRMKNDIIARRLCQPVKKIQFIFWAQTLFGFRSQHFWHLRGYIKGSSWDVSLYHKHVKAGHDIFFSSLSSARNLANDSDINLQFFCVCFVLAWFTFLFHPLSKMNVFKAVEIFLLFVLIYRVFCRALTNDWLIFYNLRSWHDEIILDNERRRIFGIMFAFEIIRRLWQRGITGGWWFNAFKDMNV